MGGGEGEGEVEGESSACSSFPFPGRAGPGQTCTVAQGLGGDSHERYVPFCTDGCVGHACRGCRGGWRRRRGWRDSTEEVAECRGEGGHESV